MKAKYPNKMAGEGTSTKALVCIQECMKMGVGAWVVGEKITDPEIIAALEGNPNFEILKEEK